MSQPQNPLQSGSRQKNRAKSGRVTLADVAAAAGVSTTTVSLVLSGREEWLRQFHVDTVQRVQDQAKRLGYRANLFASSLPSRLSTFFALVTRDIGLKRFDNRSWHVWAFEGDLVRGVVQAASELQMYPILTAADPDEPGNPYQAVERVIDGGVFGAVVRTPAPPFEKYLQSKLTKGVVVVALFPRTPSRWKTNMVTTNDRAVGEAAAHLLIAEGRKRLAIVHYRQRVMRESHRMRHEGFEQVARQHGLEVEVLKLPREIDSLDSAGLKKLCDSDADGLFAVDSVLSVDAVKVWIRLQRQPGRDVGLVGVNCSRWREEPLPEITSLDISWENAGQVAVRELSIKAQSDGATFENILLPPSLYMGHTCRIQQSGGTVVQAGEMSLPLLERSTPQGDEKTTPVADSAVKPLSP